MLGGSNNNYLMSDNKLTKGKAVLKPPMSPIPREYICGGDLKLR